MNIILASAFRNSTPYLPRYLSQCDALDTLLYHAGHRLSFIWGEGDSTDSTLAMLTAAKWRFKADVVDCTHGGADYPSVVKAERFKQLAHVGRVVFSAIPESADCVIYVEADLRWSPATMLGLIERLAEYPAISPMIMLERRGWPKGSFYDTFVYRKDGRHFEHHPPYHPCYRPDAPFLVDSAGSCMAFRGEVARKVVFEDDTIFLGICEQVYANGGSVTVDPSLACYHD